MAPSPPAQARELRESSDDKAWKLCRPVILKLRVREAEVVTPRTKPVSPVEGSSVKHRQED